MRLWPRRQYRLIANWSRVVARSFTDTWLRRLDTSQADGMGERLSEGMLASTSCAPRSQPT
jgi:hypothetical protein